MACVRERGAHRNSLIAYGHLFEPRPTPRNTLKKRRSSSVHVRVLSIPSLELADSRPAATELLGDLADPPFDLSPPFDPASQAAPTAEVKATEVLPWAWTPVHPREASKPIATVTAAELPGDFPIEEGTVMTEEARFPEQPRPRKPRNRFARPVASFKSYDPNFLMPLPPVKQPQRNRINKYATGPQPARPPVTMRDRYVMTQENANTNVGPPYAQSRPPMRRPMASFEQSTERQSAYEQWPRPPSSSSMASNMSNANYGMVHSPASSRTSFTSFDSANSYSRRPEYGSAWQRPMPIKQNRRRREPGELFRILPQEVLQCILSELKKCHMRSDSDSCATCMMRDLCSVALTCRRLSKLAQNILYEDIQLIGADSAIHKKKFKVTHGTRLVLLRRTLRTNPELAACVKSIKVPLMPADAVTEKYQDKVASVIMACPNFERLVGFHQPYDHSFQRLFHALSTREHLKEMNWFLEPATIPIVQKRGRSKSQSNGSVPNINDSSDFDISLEQSTAFFDLHSNWSQLTTLSIHSAPGAQLVEGVSMLGMTLANMPALQTLFLSNLSATAFNDSTLLSLPPLQTLSMSHLSGITSAGLSSFARRPSSQSIQKLILRHLGVDSVPALGRIFSNLTRLTSFSLVQSSAPVLPDDEVIWLYPYLASSSLRKLHWDVRTSYDGATEADRILTKSIASQGFPALRAIRAPHDPDGLFQSLCAPLVGIEQTNDQYRGLISRIPDRMKASEPSPPMSPMSPSSSKGFGRFPARTFTNDPPTPIEPSAPEESNLAHSRLSAQARIEAAKNTPRFLVNVVDEDGTIVEKFGLAGFIGQVESKIQYLLKPDAGATDENGGLLTITDLLRSGGEDLITGEGCTGRWLSWSDGMANDRREKERWWHTERARWQELNVF